MADGEKKGDTGPLANKEHCAQNICGRNLNSPKFANVNQNNCLKSSKVRLMLVWQAMPPCNTGESRDVCA